MEGKGPRGLVGGQPDPEERGEDAVEMEVPLGLCAGLAILEAQRRLGVAKGKFDLDAGAVEADEAFQRPLGVAAVQPQPLPRLQVGPVRQDVDHLQPAWPGRLGVGQVDLLVGPGRAGRRA